MKRIIITLSACCLLTVGCSKPTAEVPVVAATPVPTSAVKSERQLEKEAAEKRKKEETSVEAHAMSAEPMQDHPIFAVSPSPSPSTPEPE